MFWNAAASFACQTLARQDAYVRYTGTKTPTAKELKHGLPAMSIDSSATTSNKAQSNSANTLGQDRTRVQKDAFGSRNGVYKVFQATEGP